MNLSLNWVRLIPIELNELGLSCKRELYASTYFSLFLSTSIFLKVETSESNKTLAEDKL